MISGGSGGPIRLKLEGSWLVVPVPVNEKKNFEAEKNQINVKKSNIQHCFTSYLNQINWIFVFLSLYLLNEKKNFEAEKKYR